MVLLALLELCTDFSLLSLERVVLSCQLLQVLLQVVALRLRELEVEVLRLRIVVLQVEQVDFMLLRNQLRLVRVLHLEELSDHLCYHLLKGLLLGLLFCRFELGAVQQLRNLLEASGEVPPLLLARGHLLLESDLVVKELLNLSAGIVQNLRGN